MNYNYELRFCSKYPTPSKNSFKSFTSLEAKDVSRETSPAAKSEEKRMFSQASFLQFEKKYKRANSLFVTVALAVD